MISTNDLKYINEFLSSVFYYGVSNNYSYGVIEERIIKSKYISLLENGDSSFLVNDNISQIIEEVYDVIPSDEDLLKNNPLSMWLADVYTKAFFYFNKSFSFLFLYFPITKAIEMFPLYHEMDLEQTIIYISETINENSILSLLLKKRKISLNMLSVLSEVKYNTVVSYTRHNEFIYNAKFEHIYRISQILDVNINIFARKIYNFTNSGMYDFDKNNIKYRLYLGYYISSLFDEQIRLGDFEFKDDCLYDGTYRIFTMFINDVDDIDKKINEHSKNIPDTSKVMLVVFLSRPDVDFDKLKHLTKYGYEKISIITGEKYYQINQYKYISKPITNTINEITITLAKEKVGGDFAI